jgi:pimeloyl-ACP methyl ester carboxylesterase
MMPNELEAHRRTAATELGEISYLDVGQGPTALFVHGVFTNALFWRNVIPAVSSQRRCVAIDLPAHGQTRTTESWDLSLGGLAQALVALCDAIDTGPVDLVANDTGGAVAQIFAATNPQRLRSLTLTNCDTQGNIPPPDFAPIVDLARLSWARWLRDTIPGAAEIVEIDGAKLFFPDERAADLVPHLRRHWEATAGVS